MLKKSFFILVLIFSLTLWFTYSEDVNNANNNSSITETDSVKKANQLYTGTVTKTELTIHNGINV